MDRFSLKQLRYFEAVARFRHFGHAAQSCAISQPALSMQIKLLEEALGQPLFERRAKDARLTHFGELFRQKAEPILQSVDELDAWSQKQSARKLARLRMGIIPTIAPYILPALIHEIRHKFDGLELQLRETMTMTLLRDLHEGRLDVAMLALPTSEAGLEELELFSEPFVLVRPLWQANAPLPRRDQLKEMRWLLLEEGHCFREQALEVCNLNPNMPREVLDGSSLSTLVQMVGAGMGVTLLPEMAIALETRRAPIAITEFDEPVPQRTIGLVWRKGHPNFESFLQIAAIAKACKRVQFHQARSKTI